MGTSWLGMCHERAYSVRDDHSKDEKERTDATCGSHQSL
jgi:hypothetical protein